MCRLLLMTIALLLVLFGASGLWMMPRLVQQKIEQRLQLKIGTKTFERFTRVPIPLTVKFHLFNVTNGERVLQGLERPHFQEVGPFMFKQWRRREIVDFEDYNRRLRYREIKTFIPMFNESTKQEHEMLDPSSVNVTVINLPLLAVLTKLAQMEEGSFKRNMASLVLSRLIKEGGDKILVTMPANQLLFDGYKVSYLESARDLVSEVLGLPFESPLPRNMFGFFHNKNDTWSRRDVGELTVFTGRNDSMRDFMMIDTWNDQRQLRVWPSNTQAGNRCNEIRGTDGSQFHPGASRHQVLEIFSPMICTSIQIRYREEAQVRDIPLLRFATPPDMFAAPKKSARNACYCTIPPPANQLKRSPQTSNRSSRATISDSRCYLDGLMDLSLCQHGAPIAASSPHFYQGDPMLAQASGLKPDKLKHETYIDVEPMTGAVFRAASRAQLNAYVEEAALQAVEPSIIGRMEPMVAPLLWLEESAEIDEKSANQFKAQLLNMVQKARRSFWWSILIGFILGSAVALQYWWVTCYRNPINDSSTTTMKRLSSELANKKRLRRPQHNKELAKTRRLLRGANLAAGAQASNLLAKQKAALSSEDEEDGLKTSASAAAAAAVAVAATLGAASAGPSRVRKAKTRRDNQEEEEEDSSKRELVANEWEVGQASTSAASSAATSQAPPDAGLDNNGAATNDDDDGDDGDLVDAAGEQRDLMGDREDGGASD